MVIPIVIAIGAFALACSLVLSSIHVRFRDVGMALPIGLQLLMFASPVLYSFNVIPQSWRAFYLLNPLAGLIDAFRRSVLGLPLLVPELVVAALVTAVALPLSYVLFKHAEATMADVV
jgi:lipopolysaccharide transport system permease protein